MDLYGNFIPNFCGGLSAGDWHNLPEIWTEFAAEKYSSLIEILVNSGPYGLYKYAQQNYDFIPAPEGYSGKCHLCTDVRLHLSKMDRFPELNPLAFYDFSNSHKASHQALRQS